MKIRLFFVGLTSLLLLNSTCANDSTKITLKQLAPESQHGVAFTTAMQFIATYHYKKPQINDQFSSLAFDNYLNNVDPSHVYFLQSDLNEFEKYRNTLDETMFTGDLTFAYLVFNTYQQRLDDRIKFAMQLLSDSANFDYSINDSVLIDREKAPYATNTQEWNDLWKFRLKYECISLKVSGKSFNSYSETIKKRYKNLLNLSAKTKSEDVFQLYLNALTELADPHTNYFSPRTAADFNTQMSLSLEGIGATLQAENEHTKIVQVVRGGPADKSKKVFAGDKIIAVAQGDSELVNVVDWRLDDVVSLIRGKKGTMVRLEIIPASDPKISKVIEIKRDKIVLEDQSAKSSVKEITRNGKTYKYGVISIPAFYIDFAAASRGEKDYKSTTRDVKKLLTELKKQKINGLIVDLRNNGGGSLKEAVELSGLFITNGAIVQVKDAAGGVKSEIDTDSELFYDGPLAVLVNRFSASASEIFAAAMQDYGRGVVIGEKTFGKGTVQQVVSLNEFVKIDNKTLGDVKLTMAKFYRVNGSTTQHKGVIPDVEFPGVYDGDEFGEDASPYALPWDLINAASYTPVNTITAKLPSLKSNHVTRMKSDVEYAYLLGDIARYQKLKAEKYQTLNSTVYKKQIDEADAEKKKRDQERKARGATTPDLILDETLNVLTDLY